MTEIVLLLVYDKLLYDINDIYTANDSLDSAVPR